jgi:site-specific recombinase
LGAQHTTGADRAVGYVVGFVGPSHHLKVTVVPGQPAMPAGFVHSVEQGGGLDAVEGLAVELM